MSETLRLGPLPRTDMVRMTLILPATLKADLDRYAELHQAAFGGEPLDAAALAPHMLAAFIERDRGFKRARQPAGGAGSKPSASRSIRSASSNASETAGETSESG